MAALEGRGFQRLGETRLRHSAFRLVCATNRSVGELRRLLDPDFFDRVAVFVLEVPPLRRCREDLPDAWRSVLKRATRLAGVRPEGWERYLDHPKLLDAMQCHPLPGNFRALQRAAFHLLASLEAGHSAGRVLDEAIAALGSHEEPSPMVPEASDLERFLPVDDLRAHLRAYEGAWLRAAMRVARGNQSAAARLLGLKRKTFEDHLKKLDGDGS